MEEVNTLSLFKPVGSFAGVKVGKALVYDLGGNVAEYAIGGKSYGYGAYDFVDAAGEGVRLGDKGMGFRVVLE